jgi:hypothetical protein
MRRNGHTRWNVNETYLELETCWTILPLSLLLLWAFDYVRTHRRPDCTGQ